MQPPKVREVTSRLKREGWVLLRAKGGRRVYQKGNRVVTIHGADSDRLAIGTWAAIKRQAGW